MKSIMTKLVTVLIATQLAFAPLLYAGNEVVPPTAASKSPLFQADEILNLRLTGEFQRIHKENAGGNWTGEDHSDPKYWTDSELVDLSHPERILKAKTRARGMSSAQEGEAEFPKLRVEIQDDEKIDGTVFKKSRNFRMNTHVSTNPKTENTEMGRLNDERSPFREALAYEVARELGLITPAFRRARIQYEDTGTKEKMTRNALILETEKKVIERLDAKLAEDFPSADASLKMPTRAAALFHLYHIFIGNDDVNLKMKKEPTNGTEKYRPYFNTMVIETKDGVQFPMVYDLDLSFFVAGMGLFPNWDVYKNSSFGINDGRVGRLVYNLAWLRARMSKAEFLQALNDFNQHEQKIKDLIKKAQVDEIGRKLALEQVDLFKKATNLVLAHPMILKGGVRFYADAKLSKDLLRQLPVSEEPGTLRSGTMVKVLAEEKTVVKIAIIDSRNDLQDSNTVVGYVKKSDLKLGDDLAESDQGPIDERDMVW
jgi:hypothetical protein